MAEAYIVDAVRSPVGRRGGDLSRVHPADLGAHSLRALVDRSDVDPAAVEDVVFGCVDTIGGQGGAKARHGIQTQFGALQTKASVGRLPSKIGTMAVSTSTVMVQFLFKPSAYCVVLFWCGGFRLSRL